MAKRPLADRDAAFHEAYIDRAVGQYMDLQGDYADKLWRRVLGEITLFRLGRCSGINTSAKTVTVDLDPVTGSGGPAPVSGTVTVAWGRPTWTAAAIVGKRVRVGISLVLGYGWIVNVVNNE